MTYKYIKADVFGAERQGTYVIGEFESDRFGNKKIFRFHIEKDTYLMACDESELSTTSYKKKFIITFEESGAINVQAEV